jgi:hypothetical protein
MIRFTLAQSKGADGSAESSNSSASLRRTGKAATIENSSMRARASNRFVA